MNTIVTIAGLGILSMLSEIFHFKKQLFVLILLGLAAAIGISVMEWDTAYSYYNHMVLIDNYAIAFSVLLMSVTLLWFLMSQSYFKSESSMEAHAAIILFALCGAICMTCFSDLSMLFIGLEILSISMYVLCGSDKLNKRSNESAMKYFMMGAFATGFLLFGIALIYGTVGSFNLSAIATYTGSNINNLPMIFYAGIVLLLVGLLFKVSAAPFHFWAPDVYDGAPTVITAFMATVVKTAAFAAFYRLFATCFSSVFTFWTDIIAIVAALTMLAGNILAVYQTSVKRMLAYSSVAHAGYILMALAALSQSSKGAILLYLAAYSLSTLGVFAVLNIIHEKKLGNEISVFNGLAKSNPLAAAMISICMLSMAGIPPMAGFFGKYYIFLAALNSGFTWLVLIAVLSSLVGVYYYFRIVMAMYTGKNETAAFEIKGLPLFVLVIAGVLSIIVGLGTNFIVNLL